MAGSHPPNEDFAPPPPPTRGARVGKSLRGLAVDIAPLRASRDFRLLWGSGIVSEAGHQMAHVAIYIQVFRLTDSAAAVGLVGLVELVPLVISSAAGGWLVDALDRRKLLLFTQVAYALASGLLFVTAATDAPVGFVYLAAGLAAAIGGIASPTRSAMIPRMVGEDLLPSAIALNQVMWTATMIVGPALGGIVIGAWGLEWAYAIDVITYGATIAAAFAMRPMPPSATEEERQTRLGAIKEGFAYLRGRRVLQSTFVADLIAMIFGMPRALFPVLAMVQFHRNTTGEQDALVGFLFAALAAGALAGALTAGWVGRIRHQGRAVVFAIGVWGAAVIAFGLSGPNLFLALACLAVAGAADVISAVFRSSILQVSVPDRLRGRLAGIHILVVTGGPRLGDVEAGLVAAAFSPTISVVSGGVVCLVGIAALAAAVPQLWRYHAGEAT